MVRDMLFRRYHFENVSEIAEECGLDSHACVDIELVLNDEFQAATLGMVLKIDNAISDATYEAMQTIALIINRQSHTEQLVAAPEVAGGQRSTIFCCRVRPKTHCSGPRRPFSARGPSS